ncbi:MAG: PAS domain S-box protein [Syntrophobacteraceae bacterium]
MGISDKFGKTTPSLARKALQAEIADRKRAEEELKQANAYLENIFENSPDAIGIVDKSGKFIRWNKMAAELYGYSFEELRGKSGFALYAEPDELERMLTHLRREGLVKKREMLMRRKDGSVVPFELSISLLRDSEGRTLGSVCVARDLSEIRKVLTELKATNERLCQEIIDRMRAEKESQDMYLFLQALMDTIPNSIFYKDTEGVYLGCNKTYGDFLGINKEDIIGKSLHEMFPKGHADKYREMDLELFREPGKQQYEWEMISADGIRHDVIISKATFYNADGTMGGLIGTIVDITERKRAEKEVLRLSRQNQLILDAAGEGIAGLDRQERATFINPAGAKIVGYEPGEILGKDMHELVHHTRRDGAPYPMEECPIYQSCTAGAVSHNRNEVFWRKDGTSFPVAYSSTPIVEEGRVIGAVVTFRDITERRRAEEELARYRDHLEDLVEERTMELARTNAMLTIEIEERKRAETALQESAQKLKLFAYSVAHDLKSPAIGIYGLTKRLHKQYVDILDDKGKNYCAQILKISEHIGDLAEKINVYIATKEARPVFEKTNLKEVLRILRDEFSTQIGIRGIAWIEPEAEIEIRADRLSLLRVFRNLVDNALKYGGERLSRIAIGHETSGDFHVFSVSDNGTGLKEADAEKIFGLFQRHETSRGISGAGLGLTIVREIAEQHGGKVWVEPSAKRGTTFCVSIARDL